MAGLRRSAVGRMLISRSRHRWSRARVVSAVQIACSRARWWASARAWWRVWRGSHRLGPGPHPGPARLRETQRMGTRTGRAQSPVLTPTGQSSTGTTGSTPGPVERDDIAECRALDAATVPLGRLAGRTVPAGADLADVCRTMITTGWRWPAVISADGRLLGLLCLKASRARFCSDQDVHARALGEADPAAVGGTGID